MKNLIPFISAVLFCLNSTLGEAQLYQPLLKEANEWHLTNCFTGCFTDLYVAADDTIIQGKTYKILDGYHYISREFLLREDVANKKVYFVFLKNGKPEPEILLYDFSVSVGDSIRFYNPISPFPSDPGYFTLDSINPLPLFDGSISKSFYWSANDTIRAGVSHAVWIEGSGSLSLINAPGGLPDLNGAGKLSCHFKTGVLSYANLDSINECVETYHLSNSDFRTKDLNFSVYPNPFKSQLILENTKNLSSIQIYSSDSRLLFEKRFSAPHNSIEKIDLSHLKPSLLILISTDRNGFQHSQKISKE